VNRLRDNRRLVAAARELAAGTGIDPGTAFLRMREADDAAYRVAHPVPAVSCSALRTEAADMGRQREVLARRLDAVEAELGSSRHALPPASAPTPAPPWWKDTEPLILEAKELERTTGRPYRLCFREVTERRALADRQAAAVAFHERRDPALAGDQVYVRMRELQAGGMNAKPAILQAGREVAAAGRR
jgi:hypothetical protein